MLVIGIIGSKNSGKTTLVCNLVNTLATRGYRVSTIKHTHHPVEMDQEGTDSYKHRKAGAQESILGLSSGFILFREDQDEPELDTLLARLAPVDIVLVEGYKQHDYPKLLVHRPSCSTRLAPEGLGKIIAVVSDDHDPALQIPQLDLNNISQIAGFIEGLITSEN
jgi:molybdopterin-guanine dinucleotide biosynthesis protein MobB